MDLISAKIAVLATVFVMAALGRTIHDLPAPGSPDESTSAGQKEVTDEYARKKIAEYNVYKPENAQADALGDIAAGTLRIFFLDVEEVPQLLVIDQVAATLPEAKRISIGSGCTDDIHSEEGPTLYRRAMEKALSYGVQYNRVVAEHFDLPLKGTADLLPSESLEFFGLPDQWHKVEMELRDIQIIHGGRDIWVSGSGKAFVRVVRWAEAEQGMQERIFGLTIQPQDIERLINAALEQDFISLVVPSQPGPPDHGTPKILFTSPDGQEHSESAWSPPLPGGDPVANQRFQAVYRQFLRLETLALETLKPLYAGSYDSQSDTVWRTLLGE